MKKLFIFLFVIHIGLPLCAEAKWPVFIPPDKDFLLQHGMVETTLCPPGQGRLVDHIYISIHDSLCKTFCSPDWIWTGNSDHQCHDLDSGFNFQYFTIQHHGNNETPLYSIVSAHYVSFELVMETEKDNHWYCVEDNKALHSVLCTNDI